MNKSALANDIDVNKKIDTVKAADIDSDNYKVFLSSLDIDRTIRIYKSLAGLSGEAVKSITEGKSTNFSAITDKMRPLLSYISDNNVKLTNFLDEKNLDNSEIVKRDPNIKQFVITLRNNLQTIENVRATMGAVPFNHVFFVSEELTNAYLDYKLDLAWNFEHDVVIILNLEDMRLLDYLARRGQKRFILAGGPLAPDECKCVTDSQGQLYKMEDHEPLKQQGGTPSFPGRPMHRFVVLDVGKESLSPEEIQKISEGVANERNNMWARFNTINRADATRVLNNLKNFSTFDQTSIYHNKFEGRGAVIVCPGPSLEKNVELLKKIKGKVLIICVLHALKDLQKRGIKPDIVVHADPVSLKKTFHKKDGKDVSLWDDWINDDQFREVENFVVSAYSNPDIFEAPAKNVMWMSSGLPIGKHLPGKIFDYERVGGSVSHACFDMAVEFGCQSIALIGQDLAFSKEGNAYTGEAEIGISEEDKLKEKNKVYGNDIEVKGWDGGTAISNNTFYAFANGYTYFANALKEKEIELFNCTEGGIFIEGFNHCRFKEYIDKELEKEFDKDIGQVLVKNINESEEIKERSQETKKFLGRNTLLAQEIGKLINLTIPIAEKNNHSDDDLVRFDKLQNKVIKKMKKNIFYSLGLQRDIHIFQAGLKADPSIEGQLGYHLDFLRVAKDLNNRLKKYFSEQTALFRIT